MNPLILRRLPLFLFFVFLILFVAQVLPRTGSESISMDEEWDLANAAYYWKDLDASLKDGPLPVTGSLTGLPSRFLPLTYGPIPEGSSAEVRAYYFLYYLNRAALDALVASGRWVSLLFALGIGFLLFREARPRGLPTLAAVLALWAFDPMLLAYAGVAKNDLSAVFFAWMALLLYERTRKPGTSAWDLGWPGMAAGMAILSKPTAFFVIPAVLAMEILDAVSRPQGRVTSFARRTAVYLSGTALWIYLAYLPTAMVLGKGSSPFEYFGRYLEWIRRFGDIGVYNYFLGGTHPAVDFLAFPVSVFFKWTIPFTGLVLLGIGLGLQRKMEWPVRTWMPLVAMALLLVPGMGSKLCRHLLPVYPFLILTAAAAFQWMWDRPGKTVRRLAVLLLVWHALSSLAHHPHALSYMNDLVPRHRKAYFLSSYNWDLNQDTKRLAAVARARGWGRVRLANSGRVDPHFYGLEWDPWTREDLDAPQPGTVYVHNASLMTAPDAYLKSFALVKKSWIADRVPTGWVADTWVYHEIPGSPIERTSEVVNSFPYFQLEMIPYRAGLSAP